MSTPLVARDPGPLSRAAELDLVPAQLVRAQFEADEALRRRLEDVGLAVLGNAGLGQNLCLILSMLQSAGVPSPEQRAPVLAAELAMRDDALGRALREGQGLYADRPVFQALAERIFAGSAVPPMLVMTAGEHGVPLLYEPLREGAEAAVDPATVRHDTVVLLETPGHFEAVANVSGRPWSSVLDHLLIAPGERQEARNAQWTRHNLRAVRSMAVSTLDHNGVRQGHVWTLGVQTQMTVAAENDAGPLTLARELAEGHAAVAEFLELLEKGEALELGQMPSGYYARFHRLAVGAMGDGPMSASEGSDGTVPVRAHSLRYAAVMEVRQGRVTGLEISRPDKRDLVVKFDHPWSPQRASDSPARRKLHRPDDLDAFDEFALRAEAEDKYSPGRFSSFLRDLRQHGQGLGWREFRDGCPSLRRQYLTAAVGAKRLHNCVPAMVERVVGSPLKAERPTRSNSARESLTHPDDLAAYDAFAPLALKNGGKPEASYFSLFLRHLRMRGNGMDWETFRCAPEEVQERYLSKARQQGLHKNAPSAVRRVLHPDALVKRPRVSTLLTVEERVAYDKFLTSIRETKTGSRLDAPRFANFLLDLREHGAGITWEEFRNTDASERDRYLRSATSAHHLDTSVPMAVRRAIAMQMHDARLTLHHPKDLAAYDWFESWARQVGHAAAPPHFAAFLRDLRRGEPGGTWAQFCARPPSERSEHLRRAVDEGRLNRNAPAVVRQAVEQHFAEEAVRSAVPAAPGSTHGDAQIMSGTTSPAPVVRGSVDRLEAAGGDEQVGPAFALFPPPPTLDSDLGAPNAPLAPQDTSQTRKRSAAARLMLKPKRPRVAASGPDAIDVHGMWYSRQASRPASKVDPAFRKELVRTYLGLVDGMHGTPDNMQAHLWTDRESLRALYTPVVQADGIEIEVPHSMIDHPRTKVTMKTGQDLQSMIDAVQDADLRRDLQRMYFHPARENVGMISDVVRAIVVQAFRLQDGDGRRMNLYSDRDTMANVALMRDDQVMGGEGQQPVTGLEGAKQSLRAMQASLDAPPNRTLARIPDAIYRNGYAVIGKVNDIIAGVPGHRTSRKVVEKMRQSLDAVQYRRPNPREKIAADAYSMGMKAALGHLRSLKTGNPEDRAPDDIKAREALDAFVLAERVRDLKPQLQKLVHDLEAEASRTDDEANRQRCLGRAAALVAVCTTYSNLTEYLVNTCTYLPQTAPCFMEIDEALSDFYAWSFGALPRAFDGEGSWKGGLEMPEAVKACVSTFAEEFEVNAFILSLVRAQEGSGEWP